MTLMTLNLSVWIAILPDISSIRSNSLKYIKKGLQSKGATKKYFSLKGLGKCGAHLAKFNLATAGGVLWIPAPFYNKLRSIYSQEKKI